MDLLRTPRSPFSKVCMGCLPAVCTGSASFSTHCDKEKWQLPLKTLLPKPEERLGWLSLPSPSSASDGCLLRQGHAAEAASAEQTAWLLSTLHKKQPPLFSSNLQQRSVNSWRSEVQSCTRDHCVGGAPNQKERGVTAKDYFREMTEDARCPLQQYLTRPEDSTNLRQQSEFFKQTISNIHNTMIVFDNCKKRISRFLIHPSGCDLPRQFHNITVVAAAQTAGICRSSQEAAPTPAQTHL